MTSSAIDVCEGCRRLRKRCDKDNCVLHPCLESLWPSSRQSQGNATVFLAKYFGRKRFFKLLEAVTSQQRAELFESLLQEACGRTVNPLGGATGLLRLNRWSECQAAVATVLNGESLRPVPDAPSTPPTTATNGDPVEEHVMGEGLVKAQEPAKEAKELVMAEDPVIPEELQAAGRGMAEEPVKAKELVMADEPVIVDQPVTAEQFVMVEEAAAPS